MRIAMFTNNYKPYIGGVPISIEHLSEALRERGHEVYVFAPTYREQEEEEYVIRYPSLPFSVAKAPVPDVLTRLFAKKVRELKIDIIHVHHPALVGNVALSLKRSYGIPVVFTYHTRYEQYLHYVKPLESIENRTGIIEKYLQYFCRQCDMVAAPTPGIAEYLLEKNPQLPVNVMPTGIPEECFQPDESCAAKIRNTYKGNADYLFCTVSRLAKEKNLIFQLQGLALLKEKLSWQGKTFRHMMIGDGPQRAELEQRTRQLGLRGNIVFVGNVPNAEIRNYQAASDLFLFTSKSETQGIVVLEAMAAGNPVAAVDATGVRDVVADGKNGTLSGDDADEWSDNIVGILDNPTLYGQMREEAKKTAGRYSEASVAKMAEHYYQQICHPVSLYPEVVL